MIVWLMRWCVPDEAIWSWQDTLWAFYDGWWATVEPRERWRYMAIYGIRSR